MKLNKKCILIGFLILVVIFSNLGNVMQEGFYDPTSNYHSSSSPSQNRNYDYHYDKYNQNWNNWYNQDNPDNRDNWNNQNNNHNFIRADQRPPGNEHLYMLKSEIVPPVCPACPTCPNIRSGKNCQPCPPCGRCPEPAFDCKKVPNYDSSNTKYLPRPILNDFSQFGQQH